MRRRWIVDGRQTDAGLREQRGERERAVGLRERAHVLRIQRTAHRHHYLAVLLLECDHLADRCTRQRNEAQSTCAGMYFYL